MGRRRQWGSVRRLASGRYQARLPDGSPAPDTFPTNAEASQWLSLAEADLVRGTFAPGSMAGWPLADPIVGLAISAAILNVLRHAARDIYRRLMDRVDPDLVGQVEHELTPVRGIEAVDRVRIRWIGRELHADADVALDPTLDLAAAHDVLEAARHRLVHRIPRLGDILLHANPAGRPDAHDRTNHHRATVTAPAPN